MFLDLDLVELALEVVAGLVVVEDLVGNCLFAVLAGNPRRKEFRISLHHGTGLEEFGDGSRFLLVVALGIKDVTHLEDLPVAAHGVGDLRARHVKPLCAGGGLARGLLGGLDEHGVRDLAELHFLGSRLTRGSLGAGENLGKLGQL